ncbi:MAG: LuxR C-terminal-related transcriptional regulator [Gallionella sp.]
MPTDEFKHYAIEETKNLIEFDSCAWEATRGREAYKNEPMANKEITWHLYNLKSSFIDSARRLSQGYKPRYGLHAEITEKTVNINLRKEYAGCAIYELHYRSFNIEHVLATAVTDRNTGLRHTVSFHRATPNQPFSEAERTLKETIFPHLIETLQNNWLIALPKLFPCKQRRIYDLMATCNSAGILQFATPSFIKTCQMEWNIWRPPILPPAICNLIRVDDVKFSGEKIVINIDMLGELFLLRARLKRNSDELTPREMEVAQRFSTGEDYKTIALKLRVSPSTIKGHLNRIYAKLNINNRVSLINELNRGCPEFFGEMEDNPAAISGSKKLHFLK